MRKVKEDDDLPQEMKQSLLLSLQRTCRRIAIDRESYFHDFLVPMIIGNHDDGRLVNRVSRNNILALASTATPELRSRHRQAMNRLGFDEDQYPIDIVPRFRNDLRLDIFIEYAETRMLPLEAPFQSTNSGRNRPDGFIVDNAFIGVCIMDELRIPTTPIWNPNNLTLQGFRNGTDESHDEDID